MLTGMQYRQSTGVSIFKPAEPEADARSQSAGAGEDAARRHQMGKTRAVRRDDHASLGAYPDWTRDASFWCRRKSSGPRLHRLDGCTTSGKTRDGAQSNCS